MTTWHDREPLSEALWFAANCASHSTVELEQTIIAHVTNEDARSQMLDAFEAAREDDE